MFIRILVYHGKPSNRVGAVPDVWATKEWIEGPFVEDVTGLTTIIASLAVMLGSHASEHRYLNIFCAIDEYPCNDTSSEIVQRRRKEG